MTTTSYSATLLNNFSSGGSGNSGIVSWPGGQGTFIINATFNGSTVSLQINGPSGAWITVGPDTTKTVDGIGNFALPPCQLRLTYSGAITSAFANVARVVF